MYTVMYALKLLGKKRRNVALLIIKVNKFLLNKLTSSISAIFKCETRSNVKCSRKLVLANKMDLVAQITMGLAPCRIPRRKGRQELSHT